MLPECCLLHQGAAIGSCTEASACCGCSDLLSGSRTSRLYKALIETGQAYHANAVASYPGEKHPNALVLFGQPSNGVSLDGLDKAFQREVQGLTHNGPTAKEMARIRKVCCKQKHLHPSRPFQSNCSGAFAHAQSRWAATQQSSRLGGTALRQICLASP